MNLPHFTHHAWCRRQAGFSLIEVTLAIGIVAFAFISLFGLVPTGLNVFRASIDTSIGSQIVQEVTDIAQQTDFPTLVAAPYRLPASGFYFYDEQGNMVTRQGVPVTDPNDALVTTSIYTVQVVITPNTPVPSTGDGSGSGNGTTGNTTNVATLLVQIAKNPGHDPSPFTSNRKIPVTSYVAYVARNLSAFGI